MILVLAGQPVRRVVLNKDRRDTYPAVRYYALSVYNHGAMYSIIRNIQIADNTSTRLAV